MYLPTSGLKMQLVCYEICSQQVAKVRTRLLHTLLKVTGCRRPQTGWSCWRPEACCCPAQPQ